MVLKISICKIYEEKTIEVGVFIDRHLYKNMEEVLKELSLSCEAGAWFYVENKMPKTNVIGCNRMLTITILMAMLLQALNTQDEERVKEQLLKMVHNLFLQVSQYIYTWGMFKGYNKRVSQLQPQWCQRVQKVSAVSDHYPQVENFLMNPTFTSKGGFRIMLNGIRIYQVVKIPTMSSSFCLWLSTPWDQLREKRET